MASQRDENDDPGEEDHLLNEVISPSKLLRELGSDKGRYRSGALTKVLRIAARSKNGDKRA
ncbi:hypothetical protein [Bradyrhizobium sp. 23]|uniref:hypothetical protein n=1 Tax=Bradyrhizobium sp. 23 TaxID=2782667 RepID=UPI001FF73914|nr:hypothetical protein [Bradyrhizobium sp. 23]MCK1312529.1 hypothetical protein [Bradyrhizobium sp. 23]